MTNPNPFGKYYLLERIHVGGMAEVFRAKAFGVEGFERLVAVKRILPNIAEDQEFIGMFIEQAKLAVQLNHANIAQILDLGVVDGTYYVALEHVQGRDLRVLFDRCRKNGEPMPVSSACFVIMKMCEGLDYAHNKRDSSGHELGLVHRDVSPQHALISYDGEVKLIDFGVAKAASKGSKTQIAILKGKLGYLSPEQAVDSAAPRPGAAGESSSAGEPNAPAAEPSTIDRRSDVFACGIVLYELLTGERLFVGDSDAATLDKVRNVEILPPSTFNRRISDELERIVLKALSKEPSERYASAIDLHDALQAFAQNTGDVFSRKELAAWMKETFGNELEGDLAKLESYRQGAAETVSEPMVAANATESGPVTVEERDPTQPIPFEMNPASQHPVPYSDGVVVRAASTESAVAVNGSVPVPVGARDPQQRSPDEEFDTQIYADRHGDPNGEPQPNQAVVSGSAPRGRAPKPAADDLSATLQGWEGGPVVTMSPAVASALIASAQATAASNPPPNMPIVSERYVPALGSNPMFATPAPQPLASVSKSISRRRKITQSRVLSYAAVVGGALALAAVGATVAFRTTANSGAAASGSNHGTADPDTGFDLYVSPPGVTTWRLDGDVRTDRLPSRIRGIVPGLHQLAIDARPGFLSQRQEIAIVQGTSPKIDIVLDPIGGIKGTFQTTPPGAKVWLIIDGKRESLGLSPATAPLDPRKSYQVLFEKPGFVSINRPIVFSGSLDERIVVDLERVGVGSASPASGSASPAAGSASPSSDSAAKADTTAKPDPAIAPQAVPPAAIASAPQTAPKAVSATAPQAVPSTAIASAPQTAPKAVSVIAPQAAPPATAATAPQAAAEAAVAAAPPKADIAAKSSTAPKPSAASKSNASKQSVATKAPAAKSDSGSRSVTAISRPDVGAKRQGTLFLGSKPPCEIFIDGTSTGKYTPQKDLRLTVGKHRVTLVNPDLGVRETFVVEIKPDQVEKAIKDFSDRIQAK